MTTERSIGGAAREVGEWVAYLLMGLVASAVTALVTLAVTRPIQGAVYDVSSLRVGPTDATELAILA